MNIRLTDGLPFVSASVFYNGGELRLEHVLLDTGSAGSIIAADRLFQVGLTYSANDEVHRIRGVGGVEFVFAKPVDRLAVGELQAENFTIEVGAMDYGFQIDAILGMDFLMTVGAIVNLDTMEIYRQIA